MKVLLVTLGNSHRSCRILSTKNSQLQSISINYELPRKLENITLIQKINITKAKAEHLILGFTNVLPKDEVNFSSIMGASPNEILAKIFNIFASRCWERSDLHDISEDAQKR